MDNSDDDESYFPDQNCSQLVEESSSSSEDEVENVEILCIKENTLYFSESDSLIFI